MGSGNAATGTERYLSTRRAAWASVAALGCSALLFWLGTGLSPVAGLAWLAPLPVLLLAPYVSTGRALTVAFLAYVVGSVPSWGFYAQSSDMPLWPMAALVILSFAATLTLAVWTFRRLLVRGFVVLATLAAPAVWTAVLYVISVSNPMGIMGTLATTQADVPPVVKIAAVTGWTGVEFLVFFVPTAFAALASPGVLTASRIRAGIAGALVVGFAMGAGSLLSGSNSEHSRQIAVIAHNSSPWGVDVATPEGRRLLDSYADEITRLPAGTQTAVLPEGAFEVDDGSLALLTDRLTRTARDHDITVVVAYIRLSQHKKFNTARVIPADGGEPVSYLKHHDTVSQLGDTLVHEPGTGGRAGVEICADVNHPEPSRDYAAAGARTMLMPAADNGRNGWQHSRTALLRGVENGFAVAWAGRDGQAMIAEANGRVLADAATNGPDTFTTLVADVADGPGATPYTRYGDWFGWATVVLGLGGFAASWFLGRSRPGSAASKRSRPPEERSAALS